MFHVAEVDYTTPAGAKEHGAVQPTFAVRERALDENLPLGKWAIVKFWWASRREMSSICTKTSDSFWTATKNGMSSTIRAKPSPR